MQFLREQSYKAHHQTVNHTRAMLCELVAEKILRRFNEHNPGPKGLLLLANVLVAGFEPFQNAPPEVIQENRHAMHWAIQNRGGYERKLTSLEIAIISQSKSFLSSSACQKVVDAIYKGRLVYTPNSFIDIIPDHYKHKPISLYQPRKAPLLNQYRLIVPRTRNWLDIGQFIILLVLYILTMVHRGDGIRDHEIKINGYEIVFMIYALGWTLDEFASILEHGWQVYTQNLWSFLDVSFALIFLAYFYMRLHASSVHNHALSHQALDILSCGAPILIPRLAFNLLSENMLFVSLRAMMSDFLTLTALAVWCFGGFLVSMKWLNYDAEFQHKSITISKWMLWVWFGLDGEGIQRSIELHRVLGPVLMVAYAFLGNTLFLTILVSMLTNTFSNIVRNATQETQFRRAVLTFEGVKSDAIFAYQPPFNILALGIILPLKFVVSPRWFHKINVFCIRFLNAPLLILISLIERHTLWTSLSARATLRWAETPISPSGTSRRPSIGAKEKLSTWISRTRRSLAFWAFSRFSVHGDIQAVFDTDPPSSLLEEIEHMETWDGKNRLRDVILPRSSNTQNGAPNPNPTVTPPRRQLSSPSPANLLNNSALSRTTSQTSTTDPPARPTTTHKPSSDSSSHLLHWAHDLNSPTSYSNNRRATRKDSSLSLALDDQGAATAAATAALADVVAESNERLGRLEGVVTRLERLCVRALGGEEEGEADDEEGDGGADADADVEGDADAGPDADDAGDEAAATAAGGNGDGNETEDFQRRRVRDAIRNGERRRRRTGGSR